MPAFGDKLSDQEIRLVIEWFKSQWPKEVYDIWLERENKSR
jgi:mono/diheme cytochrome c family protein